MQNLSDDELTQVMGLGNYLGEVRQGPDGALYQWVQGVDGLGNPIGFWKALRRIGRGIQRFARKGLRPILKRALPIVQRVTSMIPHPAAQAVSRGLTVATPLLRRARIAGYDGLGALYEAPNGDLYQVQGLAEDEELMGLGEGEELMGLAQDEQTQMMGMGSYLGEVRQGADGSLYQWVQGVDGLGNPIGFWKKFKRLAQGVARHALPLAQQFIPGGQALRLVQQGLPLARRSSRFIRSAQPMATRGLRAARPYLQRANVAGYDGLGALYEAPDGSLYQFQGVGEDEELQGFAEDEELQGWGLAEDEELQGFAEDEELQGWGVGEDEELQGWGLAEDEELQGFAEDEELQGMEGYVPEYRVNGLEAFVPDQGTSTRWHTPPAQTPDMWKPLW